jgi:GNAT superfamily N-acetyltransferase
MTLLPQLTAPVPLNDTHQWADFQSGEPSLDQWLARRAAKNEASGASRTYVVCDDARVVAYYCLAAGAIHHGDAPKGTTRNMPDPMPVLVLGRLAVDQRYHNQGIGKALLLDATRRALQARQIHGVMGLLVHAKSLQAKRFYLSRGLIESPVNPMMLMLVLKTAEKVLLGLPHS